MVSDLPRTSAGGLRHLLAVTTLRAPARAPQRSSISASSDAVESSARLSGGSAARSRATACDAGAVRLLAGQQRITIPDLERAVSGGRSAAVVDDVASCQHAARTHVARRPRLQPRVRGSAEAAVLGGVPPRRERSPLTAVTALQPGPCRLGAAPAGARAAAVPAGHRADVALPRRCRPCRERRRRRELRRRAFGHRAADVPAPLSGTTPDVSRTPCA